MLTPYYRDEHVRLYAGDYREVLPALAFEGLPTFQAVVTDIPYNLSQPSAGLRELEYGDWDHEFDVTEFLNLVIPVVAGSIYVWCHETQISEILLRFREEDLIDRALAWVKANPTVINGDKLWLPGLELCAFGKRRAALFNEHCHPGVWTASPDSDRVHPNQKPEHVIQHQITASTAAGDWVLDPLVGSGTTLVAAKARGRCAIGIEREEAYLQKAAERLSQGVLGLEEPSGSSRPHLSIVRP